MKKLKNTMTILIVMFISMIILSGNVSAASTTIKASASKVTVGKNVSITVSFGENVSAAQFILNYDTNVFEYVSNSASAYGGTYAKETKRFSLLDVDDRQAISSVTFTFKSLKTATSVPFNISGLVLPNSGNTISTGTTNVTVQKATTTTTTKPKATPTPTPENPTPETVVKNELEALILEIEDLVETDYTVESWKALQEIIEKAQNATTNAEYDEVKDKLKVENLVIESFEKTELNQLLRALIGKVEKDYTEESWKELQDAIEIADNAKLKSEYDEIKEKLTVNILVEKSGGDNPFVNFFEGLDEQERITLALGVCVAVLFFIIIILIILYRREKRKTDMGARRLK